MVLQQRRTYHHRINILNYLIAFSLFRSPFYYNESEWICFLSFISFVFFSCLPYILYWYFCLHQRKLLHGGVLAKNLCDTFMCVRLEKKWMYVLWILTIKLLANKGLCRLVVCFSYLFILLLFAIIFSHVTPKTQVSVIVVTYHAYFMAFFLF